MEIDGITEIANDYLIHHDIPQRAYLIPFSEITTAIRMNHKHPSKVIGEVIEIVIPADSRPVERLLAERGFMFADRAYINPRNFTFAVGGQNPYDVILCKNILKKAWKGAKKAAKQLGKNIKSKAEQGWHELTKGAHKVNEWVKSHAGNGGGQVEVFGFDFGPNANRQPVPPPANYTPPPVDPYKSQPLPQANIAAPLLKNTPPIALPYDQLFPQNPLTPPNPYLPGHHDVNHFIAPPNFYADTVHPASQTSTLASETFTPEEFVIPRINDKEDDEKSFLSGVIDLAKNLISKDIVHPTVEIYGWIEAQFMKIGNTFGLTSEDPAKQQTHLQQDVQGKHEWVDKIFGTNYAATYEPEYQEFRRSVGLEPVNLFIPFFPSLAGRAVLSHTVETRIISAFEKGTTFEESLTLVNRELAILEETGIIEAKVAAAVKESIQLRGELIQILETNGKSIGSLNLQKLETDISQWLGERTKLIRNHAGDPIFLSSDGLRKVRFDFMRPYPHENPHLHFEELIDDKWQEIIKIYPNDVPHK